MPKPEDRDEDKFMFFLNRLDSEFLYKFEILVLEYDFKITKNPLLVWRAIRLSSIIGRLLYKDLDLTSEQLGPNMPLPTWCMSYLHETASKIEYLADGNDIESYPRVSRNQHASGSDKKPETSRFMDKVPWALDF